MVNTQSQRQQVLAGHRERMVSTSIVTIEIQYQLGDLMRLEVIGGCGDLGVKDGQQASDGGRFVGMYENRIPHFQHWRGFPPVVRARQHTR